MSLHHQVDVTLRGRHVAHRRHFLRTIAAGGMAGATFTWSDWVTAQTQELRKKGKACILLWMQGGPSQFETFSPKPGHKNGGDTKAISTSVPGIQVSENLPQLAEVMGNVAILRSMTSKEGSHPRATYLLHTGRLPNAALQYPTLGSLVANENAGQDSQLPAFVRIGSRLQDGGGGGLLGKKLNPYLLGRAGQRPAYSEPITGVERFKRRLELAERLERDFADAGGARLVRDHQELTRKTSRMILSPQMDAFDINNAPAAEREPYGSGGFATSCFLARRLVESGVTFVEIVNNGWDTHGSNARRTGRLCQAIDQPFAQLITDLESRGMLQDTLIVWMGEFGRTPKINGSGGRDHYPRAWTAALAGGGINGGQVIGATSKGGEQISDRPVTVPDLIATVCTALDIDPSKENMSPIGRPIKIVDDGQAVGELFS